VVALKGGGEEDALAAMPPQATPQPSDPGTPALQFTGALPDPTLATGSPTPSVPSATPSPSTPGDEAVTGNDPAFITPPGKAQVSAQDQTLLAPVQADPQVPPPTDPDHLKPQPTPQAAVAELASQAKAAPIPERTGPSGRMPTAEATAAATLTRHADAPIPSDHSAEAQNSPSAGTQFSEAELQPSAENGKAATAFAISPSAAATTAEALAVKPSALAQTPVLHGADGSAMALTSILPRAGATAATPAAAATPASATQPSVAVIQVEGGLRWMLKGGAQEAQLQLHPDSLGQVTIHLKVVGSEVHARLWITEPGSVQAVQEGRSHLEASLREQGLQLGSFDLQQGQRPFQEAPSAASFHEPATLDPTTARQEAPLSASISILNPHHVELYA
jgi:flagellar hook-length control protein FliK